MNENISRALKDIFGPQKKEMTTTQNWQRPGKKGRTRKIHLLPCHLNVSETLRNLFIRLGNISTYLVTLDGLILNPPDLEVVKKIIFVCH